MSNDLFVINLNNMREETTIINRIVRIMEYYSENITTFAKRIGVDKSNLSKMLSGQRTIKEGIVNKIVLATEFRKDWLLNGEGDPLLEDGEWYEKYAKGKPNEEELVQWYNRRLDFGRGKTDTKNTPIIKTEIKSREKVIPEDVWEVIQLQAKSLSKRDDQIDELIKMLKDQKGVAGGAKSVAPKAALG